MGWNGMSGVVCSKVLPGTVWKTNNLLHGGSAVGCGHSVVSRFMCESMIIKRVSGERAFGTYFRVTPIRAPCSKPIVQLLNWSNQDALFGPLCVR